MPLAPSERADFLSMDVLLYTYYVAFFFFSTDVETEFIVYKYIYILIYIYIDIGRAAVPQSHRVIHGSQLQNPNP